MSIAVESEIGQSLGATTAHIPSGSVREEQQSEWPISGSTHTGGVSLAPILRCSSVTDPFRICSLVTPRLGAKSISAAILIVFKRAVRGVSHKMRADCWKNRQGAA
jgi:hypothetical protein